MVYYRTINGIKIEEQPLNEVNTGVIKHNGHQSAGSQTQVTSTDGKGKLKANALSQVTLMR